MAKKDSWVPVWPTPGNSIDVMYQGKVHRNLTVLGMHQGLPVVAIADQKLAVDKASMILRLRKEINTTA